MPDIKAMAVECGAFTDVILRGRHDGVLFTPLELEKFAQLVAMECAEICESEPERQRNDGVYAADQKACASAIRARFGLEG